MLLDDPIVAFDIETIPDPEIGRRLFDMRGSDAEVIHEMTHRRLQVEAIMRQRGVLIAGKPQLDRSKLRARIPRCP